MRPSSPRNGDRDVSTAAASCKFVAHQSAIIRGDGGLQPVTHIINRPAPSTNYILLYICYTHIRIIRADCCLQSSPGRGRPHTPPVAPCDRAAPYERERERRARAPCAKAHPQRLWAAGHSRPSPLAPCPPPAGERGANREGGAAGSRRRWCASTKRSREASRSLRKLREASSRSFARPAASRAPHPFCRAPVGGAGALLRA